MKVSEMKVELLDSMGSDLTVVNAARVSFSKASEWEQPHHFKCDEDEFGRMRSDWPQIRVNDGPPRLADKDVKLIHYLATHNHWTPFGHCFAQFRVKAPIFVARQLVKHQVGLVWNEESRRYIDSEPEFWLPEHWRVRPHGSMKQGSGGEHPASGAWAIAAGANIGHMLGLYNAMIADGVAPEQARMVLPQNMMTEWYWSGSLAAWARVCKLRRDSHAQYETSVVANRIHLYMFELFPVSWEALTS